VASRQDAGKGVISAWPAWHKSRRLADLDLFDAGKLLRYYLDTEMPRKLRQLMADLERAGFVNRGGKGSHRNYMHPTGARVTLSGQPGCDAQPYQERQVRRQIEASQT